MAIVSIVLCSVYIFLGFLAFIVFLCFGNYPSAMWGLASGLISLLLGHLHWLEHKQRLDVSYNDRDIKQLFFLGCLCFILGCIGFLFHMTYEIVYSKGILPVYQSEIISMIWAFMTLKSGLALAISARRFRRVISSDYIVSENTEEAP